MKLHSCSDAMPRRCASSWQIVDGSHAAGLSTLRFASPVKGKKKPVKPMALSASEQRKAFGLRSPPARRRNGNSS